MARAQPKLLTSGCYYVAHAETALVACGGWSLETPGTEEKMSEVGHIRHFATNPAWAGLGIARSIYAQCEEQARAAGVARFECYSTLNGELFYAALGFSRIKRIEIPMGPDVMLPAIHMSRPI
jgi:N-acetylglutamate synthase-like GNAT family acetyltransferase